LNWRYCFIAGVVAVDAAEGGGGATALVVVAVSAELSWVTPSMGRA